MVMSLEGERALLPTATVASNYWVWKVIHVYWFFFTFSLWLITKTRTSFSTNKEQNRNQQPFSHAWQQVHGDWFTVLFPVAVVGQSNNMTQPSSRAWSFLFVFWLADQHCWTEWTLDIFCSINLHAGWPISTFNMTTWINMFY